MNTIKLLAVAAIALIGCGDNKSVPDARPIDARPADAYCSDCPAAPALGMQIDRMGRAAVNTVLNHGFEAPSAAQQAAKTAYNEDGDKTSWLQAARIVEFMKNLALVDALDAMGTAIGCGNQALYKNDPNADVNDPDKSGPESYADLAKLLAHDELFLDSSKSNCVRYLAVEFAVVTGAGEPLSCGGRAPDYDVIDFSLSMLTMGVGGFSTDGMFTPKVSDTVDAHTDLEDTFPYLGAPHQP